MLAPLLAIFLVVQTAAAGDTVSAGQLPREPVDSATLATAYADPGARELVRRARIRQDSTDRSILAYRALARQRVSVGLSTFRRERLLFRRESAARIHWRRYGPLEIDLLGAREVIPPASAEVRVPAGLESTIPHFLFDPSENRFLPGSDPNYERDGLRHPLAPGSEADYRFASGDTTVIALPDGREVRLFELRLTPRRADPLLVSGSLWIEADGFALVQGAFRIARPYDFERDEPEEELRGVPGILKPIRADLRYLTVDYGFWEMRWWLPRVIAFEGYASAGSLIRVPIRYELSYSEYEVFADASPVNLPELEAMLPFPGDSTAPRSSCRRRSSGCRCIQGRCRPVDLRFPADSAALLAGPELPSSIFDDRPAFIDEYDVESALARLKDAAAPAEFVGPRLFWGLGRPGLLAYNRVEGLATALRVNAEYGRWSMDLTPRLAWAEPRNSGARLDLGWEGVDYRMRFGLYREIAAVDPAQQPFDLSNSLGALLWGRDIGDYLGVWGAEVRGGPQPGRAARFDWRVYAERQRPVENATWTSLRRLWSDEDPFRSNFIADSAALVGLDLELRIGRGFDPAGFRWGARVGVEGAMGSHDFARPSLGLELAGPLPGGFLGSVAGEAGSSIGTLPAQRLWMLGGTPTLRGYAPLAATGSSFWRVRGEVGTRMPAGRIILFSDLGWAGSRGDFPGVEPLVGAGVGASILDGLLRIDLARALRGSGVWRLGVGSDLAL